MSMLDTIRKGIDSSVTRVVIGAVLFAFVFWNVDKKSDKDDATIVATVNGTSITRSDYARVVQATLRSAGSGISNDQREALAANVKQQMIKEEALVQEAERLGFFISDDEIRRDIIKDENFKGEDGKFDEKRFQSILKNNGFTKGSYEILVRRRLMLSRLDEVMSGVVQVSDKEAQEWFRRQQTSVELQYVRLATPTFLDDITVTDAERDAYIAANGPKIEAKYKADYDRFYNIPKRYQLRLILLRSDIAGSDKAVVQAKAEQIRSDALAGKDFAELAKRWSEDLTASAGGGLGIRPAAQFDAAEIAAADAAGVGKVTAVTETSRGFEILLVEKVEEAKVISQEEATPTLAVNLLKEEKVGQVMKDYATSLITAWSSTKMPPVDLLQAQGLSVESTGPFPIAKPDIPMIGTNAEISKLLQTSPPGTVLPQTYEIRGLSYVVVIGSKNEPTQEEFEKQKGMVRAQLLYTRRQSFMEGWSSDVVSRATVETFSAPKPR